MEDLNRFSMEVLRCLRNRLSDRHFKNGLTMPRSGEILRFDCTVEALPDAGFIAEKLAALIKPEFTMCYELALSEEKKPDVQYRWRDPESGLSLRLSSSEDFVRVEIALA